MSNTSSETEYLHPRYDGLKKPSLIDGSTYAIAGTGCVSVALFEGGAFMSVLVKSKYTAFDDGIISTVVFNYKILTYLWPTLLFGYNQLMVVRYIYFILFNNSTKFNTNFIIVILIIFKLY